MNEEILSAVARIRIRKPAPEVFSAFADADKMSAFWFTRRDAGLEAGKTVEWFLGTGADAPSFNVHIKEVNAPSKLIIAWERDGHFSQVAWSFEETEEGHTILTISETGFAGHREEIIAQALDSTGGFNQVIVAAKAFIEYGAQVNIVADHV